MEYLPKDEMLEYNDDTLEAIRKSFDLDKPGVMADKVNILEEWIKQQNHFIKKDFELQYLELTIIASKGSIERAKSRLDRACTVRTLIPHQFCIFDVKHHSNTDLKVMKHSVLPKLTKNNARVYLEQISGDTFEDTMFKSYVHTATYVCEYIRRHDYASSDYVVFDLMDADLVELLKKVPVTALQDLVMYALDCCGFRVGGIYVISQSRVVGTLIGMLKQVVSAKIGNRIHTLKDRESLKDAFDITIFPEDYGGKENCLEKLQDKWLDVLTSEDHIRYMKNMFLARTDESKRQCVKFNEEYLGMPGSFRKLNVD